MVQTLRQSLGLLIALLGLALLLKDNAVNPDDLLKILTLLF